MKAVIMAAGKSTRTYPLTLTKPKPLLKVRNKTLLEQNLDQLTGLVEEVIILVGYKGDMIRRFIKSEYKGLKIRYAEQKNQLGTGHAALQIEKFIEDKFIILNGDDLFCKEDILECLNHDYAVVAKEVPNPEIFGIFKVDYNNYVKDLIEKPKEFISNLANCGLYLFDKKIFPILKKIKPSLRGEIEITDALRGFAKTNNVYCVKSRFWIPMTNPWSLLEAQSKIRVRENIKGVIEEGAVVESSDIVEGTMVSYHSIIKNSIIGKDCEINAEIINSSIGDNCKITGNVENSIVYDNSEIIHSDIAYSVIDSSKLENVIVLAKNNKGAVIASNCKINNTTLHSEVRIWPGKDIKNKELKNDVI